MKPRIIMVLGVWDCRMQDEWRDPELFIASPGVLPRPQRHTGIG